MKEYASETSKPHGESLLVARFAEDSGTEKALRRLADADFPMDMVSVLGHGQTSGDDLLGLYYPSAGERMRGWGRAGAFWGGLWGLLTGAAGLFLVPGVGPLLAAGPIVEMFVAGLAGAGLTGGVMAGAAAVTQLAVALHRSGVPEERLDELHKALVDGDYLIMLRTGGDDSERWSAVLSWAGAREVDVFPYTGVKHRLRSHEA
jgi:hypothetical protein